MQYDPIKRILGNVFNRSVALRKTFYVLLDLLLLRAWHIHKELNKFKTRNNLSVLDAGSGFGQYTYYMYRHFNNCSIKAVDVKAEQVEDCNRFFKKLNAQHVIFNVEDLTQYKKADAFDLVLCVDVMEHIEKDMEVFKNFFESLKPEGMVMISTPSDLGGSDAHDPGDASFIEEHVRNGYNMEEIKSKLYSAGFSRVEARYTYGKPGSISWRLSMKYPVLMLGTSKLFFLVLPFYYLLTFPFCCVFNYFDVTTHHVSGTGLLVKAWK